MSESFVTNYPSNLFVDWALKVIGQPCDVRPVRSGAHSSVYRLGNERTWFVKIADNLSTEIEKLQWLQHVKMATPELVAQNIGTAQHAILITGIPGSDLADLSQKLPKETIVERLAYALKTFHGLDVNNCPFNAYLPGDKLVHGDACLPNIIYNGGQLAGYVDVMDMGVGSTDVDLSAAIWSLQFNLGPGYGRLFLEKYGHRIITDEEVSRLHRIYEGSPIFER